MNTLTFDVETSTKNKGHVFTPENFLVSYSLKWNDNPATFHYYTDIDFNTVLRNALSCAGLVVGFNIKFDLHWAFRNLGCIVCNCPIYDCSLAEFILTGQEAVLPSLDETLASYGLEAKDDRIKEYWNLGINTQDIPYEVLEEYNKRDVDLTYKLYLAQRSIMSEKQLNLVYKDGEDLLALVHVEQAGMKWDREGATAALKNYQEECEHYKKVLWEYVPDKAVPFFNWESGDHLSLLLYGGEKAFDAYTETEAVYKSGEKKGQAYLKRSWYQEVVHFPQHFRPLEGTELKKCVAEGYTGTMYYQVDEPTLKQLKTRSKASKTLIDTLQALAKTKKLVEMLEELFKVSESLGWEDNLLHGQYNQNIVATGRLSSSKPNMQNKPPELDKFLVSRYAH